MPLVVRSLSNDTTRVLHLSTFPQIQNISIAPDQTVELPSSCFGSPGVLNAQLNYLIRTGRVAVTLEGTAVSLANAENMYKAAAFPSAYATVTDLTALGNLPSVGLPELTKVEVTDGVTPVGLFLLIRSFYLPETVGSVVLPKDASGTRSAWLLVRTGAG